MTATIIILPSVRVERHAAEVTLTLSLSDRDIKRLRAFANEWRMSEAEAARAIVSAFVNPKSRKR